MNRYYQRTPIGSPPRPHNPLVTTGQWVWIIILSCIPVVNLFAFFIWAFDSTVLPTKRNYARAILVIMLALILLAAVGVFVATMVLSQNLDDLLKSLWELTKGATSK